MRFLKIHRTHLITQKPGLATFIDVSDGLFLVCMLSIAYFKFNGRLPRFVHFQSLLVGVYGNAFTIKYTLYTLHPPTSRRSMNYFTYLLIYLLTYLCSIWQLDSTKLGSSHWMWKLLCVHAHYYEYVKLRRYLQSSIVHFQFWGTSGVQPHQNTRLSKILLITLLLRPIG